MKLLSIMILHKNPSLGQTRLLKGEYELGSFSFFTKRNAQVSFFNFLGPIPSPRLMLARGLGKKLQINLRSERQIWRTPDLHTRF